MTFVDIAIICGGAIAGGFVSGLAGFGTALMTIGIWLHALEPATAAILTLICSVSAQLQSLKSMRQNFDKRQVLPFVIPGLVGVPLGVLILPYIDAQRFKTACGLFLIIFATSMLMWRTSAAEKESSGGVWAEGAVGFFGGVLGGLAGLSGALPTMWASVRGWPKARKKTLFQVFNLSILGAALLAQLAMGRFTSKLLVPTMLALPSTILGAWIGICVYHRLSDRNFSDVVMALIFLSGSVLLLSSR